MTDFPERLENFEQIKKMPEKSMIHMIQRLFRHLLLFAQVLPP